MQAGAMQAVTELHGAQVVNFSGGKDSTAMLLLMIEKGMKIDRIVNVDTTKEFPAMYRHIDKVRRMVEPLVIETYSFDFDYYLSDVVIQRGPGKGRHGYGWTGALSRWCTQYKIRTIERAVPEPHTSYLGIAIDERHRFDKMKDTAKIKYRSPLIDWGMTESDALAYCYSRGLDWEGLYKEKPRLSCWCCPLQRTNDMRILYRDFPELWQQLKEMDARQHRAFKGNNRTVEYYEKRFQQENAKNNQEATDE